MKQNGANPIDLQFLIPDIGHREDAWLSGQFNHFLFTVYKFWLALTYAIAICIVPGLTLYQFQNISEQRKVALAILTASSILTGVCCAEMLFAMIKRKPEFAHKSYIKFQYSIMGIGYGLTIVEAWKSDFSQSKLFQMCVVFGLSISVLMSFFGSFAVLAVFKKNNRLRRLGDLHDNNQQTDDFVVQNALITDELLKFDEQLNRWPFLLYKIWLKFAVAVQLFEVCSLLFSGIQQDWNNALGEIPGDIYILMLCLWTAFCCYEVEYVLTTKTLEESKKAVFHLQISIFMFIITPATAADSVSLNYVCAMLAVLAVPLITLIGAVHINKIIEQRDQFAKASSYDF